MKGDAGALRDSILDLAVVGGGVAGSYVASFIRKARPDWSIALFERSSRIGGRLHSIHPPELTEPIELGGMRYLTDQTRMTALIDELGVQTRPFIAAEHEEDRLVLRGRSSRAGADAGQAYDLTADERGLSDGELLARAFEQLVPGVSSVDADACVALCQGARFRDGRLSDVPIAAALATALSPEATRFVMDAFGYYSGINAFNAADLIPFLLRNNPNAKARTPVAGMDVIPRSLAMRFAAAGGTTRLGHELIAVRLERTAAGAVAQRLRFANGASLTTRRLVLALPLRALEMLAAGTPTLQSPDVRELLHAVAPWPATKLYLWYERAWWRDRGFRGRRVITDLGLRKLYYLDDRSNGSPALLLAAYTDGPDVESWRALAEGAPAGAPASERLLEEVTRQLRMVHPEIDVPRPLGSSFVLWGSDAHECAWHFWSAGARSQEMLPRMIRPDPTIALFVCGEAWSRAQSWVEGALETAAMVCESLVAQPDSTLSTG